MSSNPYFVNYFQPLVTLVCNSLKQLESESLNLLQTVATGAAEVNFGSDYTSLTVVWKQLELLS